MKMQAMRGWAAVHKWSSLVCTAFLLIICLTGLPLIFSDEIRAWQEPHIYDPMPAGTTATSLDVLAQAAHTLYPGEVVTSIYMDDDEPQAYVWLAPTFEALERDPPSQHYLRFDSRTGKLLERSQRLSEEPMGFMTWMRRLHTDWFAGLAGELFLGFMALLFVVAVVSGTVLYGPFMKKQAFGSVRTGRSARLRWLDLHNLLGIVTLVWASVVGFTGLVNELSTPLFALWQRTDVQELLTPYHGQPQATRESLAGPQAALDAAQAGAPGVHFGSVIFPGSPFGSPHHYVLWGKGDSPLTSRMFRPALIDARNADVTALPEMPWYLRALQISRPLHFGDYGGMPLKWLWAVLDLITVVVLGSGLYLWIARRKTQALRTAQTKDTTEVRP